uniref:RNA helicase n=1 Tax=Anopheles atroparvus TaxID=41427 RepID=A0A240PP38_ANOAO
MLRLLLWLFRGGSQDENNVKTLQERVRRMERELLQHREGGNKTLEKAMHRREQEAIEPTNCFKKTGRVSDIRGDHIVVDKVYFVPKSMLKSCIGSEDIEENTRLSFLAFRKIDAESGESTVKVVKIESVVDEIWTPDGMAAKQAGWGAEANPATVYYQRNTRREPGRVIDKEGNVVTVETDSGGPFSVDMDKTRMSFVPMLGDYVTLDCLVQMDQEFVDLKGEVLEVLAIEPSRTVNGTGKISTVDPRGGEIFAVSGKYVYQSECLTDSYRPSVGDTVTFQAIENEQVQMRCLSVQLVAAVVQNGGPRGTPENSRDRPSPADGREELWKDKQGMTIAGNFEVNLKSIGETVERTITVKNESKTRQKILEAKPMNKRNSLVTLKSPAGCAQLILFPGETAEYVFSISADSFFGRHREAWIWMFAGKFQIGRSFCVNIGETGTTEDGEADGHADVEPSAPVYNAKQKQLQQKLAALNMRRELNTARIVPGQAMAKKPNFVAATISMYNVPTELFDLVLTAQSSSELMRILGQPPYCLDEPLSARTYMRRFDHCIYLEEIHQCIAFRQHDIERGHFRREDNFMALHVPNIIEARPSLVVGDVLNATAPWSQEGNEMPPVYQGIIHKVLQNRVLVKFDPTFHARYNGESYRITFSYSRGSYRKMHHAIAKVKAIMGPEYLFPDAIATREPSLNVRLNARDELVLLGDASGTRVDKVLPWQNPNLNHYQKAAIMNVLRGETRPMPYVIFGPPGTGKTMTTVELIHQLALNAPDCRLIVATPSNSAAYLITERLAMAGVLAPGDFIRLVSSNQVERELIPEHLAPYCATVDIAEDRCSLGEVLITESGLRMKCQAKHIGRHRVTISTCSAIGTLMQLRFPHNHFTHVIIDEAGQSVEPDTLIPLTQINRIVGSVTLVGDPKQLGPTVLSYEARDYGFNVSLMERLLNTARPYGIDRQRFPDTFGYDPRLVTKLCINYRSTPSVLALYSDIFYDSQLLPEQNTVEDFTLLTTLHEILNVKRPTADYGFFFCGIDGTNKQSPDSPSWFNPAEACMVHKIVERLFRCGYNPNEIGIVTPYVMQAKTIRHIFKAASLESPKVGSVEEFQGQERRIMIVSTVRSSRALITQDKGAVIGFISAPKRVNVAISRAKVALVVIGNPKLLGIDRIWVQVLRRAVDNDTYVGCTLGESLRSAIQTGAPLL